MSYDARDIATLHARCVLGVANSDEIYEFAVRSLREPVDENILAITICDKSDRECIEEAARHLFDEHGLSFVTLKDALTTFAADVSLRILDGSLAVRTGAELIVNAVRRADLTEFHELDPFIYAISEMDERPDEVAFFESALIEEANRWALVVDKTE